jgi:hypothetical protein
VGTTASVTGVSPAALSTGTVGLAATNATSVSTGLSAPGVASTTGTVGLAATASVGVSDAAPASSGASTGSPSSSSGASFGPAAVDGAFASMPFEQQQKVATRCASILRNPQRARNDMVRVCRILASLAQ